MRYLFIEHPVDQAITCKPKYMIATDVERAPSRTDVNAMITVCYVACASVGIVERPCVLPFTVLLKVRIAESSVLQLKRLKARASQPAESHVLPTYLNSYSGKESSLVNRERHLYRMCDSTRPVISYT